MTVLSNELPELGIYGSNNCDCSLRVIVEEVYFPDKENRTFFLVNVIDRADYDDENVIGAELAADEWFDFVKQYDLKYLGDHYLNPELLSSSGMV